MRYLSSAAAWKRVIAAAASSVAVTFALAPPAQAELSVIYNEVGRLQLSLDGSGTNQSSGTLSVEKPAGAKVRRAFLIAASTGASGFTPPDGAVSLDEKPVSWLPEYTIASSIASVNVLSDVTSLVETKLNAAPAGKVDLVVAEEPTQSIDGEALAVVFEVPTAKESTVALMYGAQATTGDSFTFGLKSPLLPSSTARLGVGISYGYQVPGFSDQYSEVRVNQTLLTSSAGGQDDGEPENGALMTVGGVGDDPDNPADPTANAACESSPRCDDELYDLKPFAGDATSFDVTTLNPSNDDNVFLAAFELAGVRAAIGDSLSASPSASATQVGTKYRVTANAQDAQGDPVVGEQVTLAVTDGPNTGRSATATTGADGNARFNFQSEKVGTDTLVASYVGDDGETRTAPAITKVWAPRIANTFGGQWPFAGEKLQLFYTYDGSYKDEMDAAERAWDDSGTKVSIDTWSSAPAAVHLPVSDVSRRDTWWGVTLFAEDCWSCGYTRNAILLNTRTLDPESDDQRVKTLAHEFGHALGLEHPASSISAAKPSLMRQGRLSTTVKNTPQQYDTDRVKGMYP